MFQNLCNLPVTCSGNSKDVFWFKKPSMKTVMFLAQNVLFQLTGMTQSVLGQFGINLYSYRAPLIYQNSNSLTREYLCQMPTTNHPPMLHLFVKSPEHHQRGAILASMQIHSPAHSQGAPLGMSSHPCGIWLTSRARVVLGSRHLDWFNKWKY